MVHFLIRKWYTFKLVYTLAEKMIIKTAVCLLTKKTTNTQFTESKLRSIVYILQFVTKTI